jgi:uncharacterized protein YecE (DUF72 family)
MIHFGTCSWKYDAWRGIVYPEQGKINYLREYGRTYHTVEIDQWFWVMPKNHDVEQYVKSVPADFIFSVKVPNAITLTHPYKKQTPNPNFLSIELFNQFIDVLKPMHNNLGVLMFQFEYLNKQKMKSLEEFIALLDNFFKKCPSGFKYGIEIRNPNYLKDSYFKFLQKMGISHVFLQGYYMPSIIDVYYKFADFLSKTPVIRLHGANRSGIEERSKGGWNKIYDPKDDEISKITEIIRQMDERKLEVYVYTNNHYEGSVPLTIEKIRGELK